METENIPLSFYFLPEPEDVEDDMIADFPGNYNEDDVNGKCFFNTSIEVCRTHFSRAYQNLSPLFGDKYFRSLSVYIDLSGVFNATACYLFDYSDEKKGEYYFSASRSALNAYLKNYWDSDFSLSPFYWQLWEHELIHMLDHKYGGYKSSPDSTNCKEFWIHYLLSFRSEGVAELYDLMKGHNPIKDMNSARSIFRSDVFKLILKGWYDSDNIQKSKKQINESVIYYSVGQWMVLHALSCSDDEDLKSLLQKVFLKINNGLEVNDQDMFIIIKHALELDVDQFIRSLVKCGSDGRVFISPVVLNEIPKRIIKYQDRCQAIEPHNNNKNDDLELIRLFDLFWPAKSIQAIDDTNYK